MLPKFTGQVKVRLKAQEASPKAIQALLRANLGDGNDLPKEVLHNCRIANDAAARFAEGVTDVDGNRWVHNPGQKPLFGRTPYGEPYLTVCLVGEVSGERISARWEGEEAFPKEVQRVAINHDLGKAVKAKTITLPWNLARVRAASNSNKKQPRDVSRKHEKNYRDREGRKYARLCEADLVA